jgi:hypothetical protein
MWSEKWIIRLKFHILIAFLIYKKFNQNQAKDDKIAKVELGSTILNKCCQIEFEALLALKKILTWKFLNEKVNMRILVNGQQFTKDLNIRIPWLDLVMSLYIQPNKIGRLFWG